MRWPNTLTVANWVTATLRLMHQRHDEGRLRAEIRRRCYCNDRAPERSETVQGMSSAEIRVFFYYGGDHNPGASPAKASAA